MARTTGGKLARVTALVACGATVAAAAAAPAPWGGHGHLISGQAAATALPPDMPEFFHAAAEQLAYLNYEPDRWRERELREMDQGFSYDHYIDLENVPDAARTAPDRFNYLEVLYRQTDLAKPERDGGLLPFRILELYGRLLTGFRRWRASDDSAERAWIAQRIINDAGVLGHYVADGAQPHHTTIHFNGWNSETPNPRGFTIERDFHSRFESGFVEANVRLQDVLPGVQTRPRRLEDVRAAVWSYLLESNEKVTRLYELEQEFGFVPNQPGSETKEFAIERLAAGANMLRALWWTAWLDSEPGG